MNASPTTSPVPESTRQPHSREAPGSSAKTQVLLLLGFGYSRRMAARHIGCTHTTIARAMTCDPHFAAQVAATESRVDLQALQKVGDAARQEKYWRAAVWLLERRNPDKFGRHAALRFSGDQVMTLLAEVFSAAMPALRDDCKEQFLRSFNGK